MNRNIPISNLKGLLIFLVVFGHFIELYAERYPFIYLFIYAFHMPLFIFISGLLSKRPTVKKVLNFFLLYLIFQSLYGYYYQLIDAPVIFQYDIPYFHLWYLLSMMFWMLIALGINQLKNKHYKIGILFLIIVIGISSRLFIVPLIALLQPYFPEISTHYWSIQRTLTFLPFFFIGHYINKDMIVNLQPYLSKYRLLILSPTILIFYLITKLIPVNWETLLKGNVDFTLILTTKDISLSKGILIGMLHLMVSSLLAIAVFISAPKKETILTTWGDNSLPIYLLHPFFLFIFSITIAPKIIDFNSSYTFIVLILCSFLVTYLLNSSIISVILKPFFKPTQFIEKLIALTSKIVKEKGVPFSIKD